MLFVCLFFVQSQSLILYFIYLLYSAFMTPSIQKDLKQSLRYLFDAENLTSYLLKCMKTLYKAPSKTLTD